MAPSPMGKAWSSATAPCVERGGSPSSGTAVAGLPPPREGRAGAGAQSSDGCLEGLLLLGSCWRERWLTGGGEGTEPGARGSRGARGARLDQRTCREPRAVETTVSHVALAIAPFPQGPGTAAGEVVRGMGCRLHDIDLAPGLPWAQSSSGQARGVPPERPKHGFTGRRSGSARRLCPVIRDAGTLKLR